MRTRESGSSAPPAPLANPFVGREREMAQLAGALDTVHGGNGQLYLIVGEAGIGKTRLAEEIARHARTRVRVLVGRCVEGEGAPAFWPWIQIIRAYVRERDAAALAAEMGAWAPDIAQIVPELHEQLPGLAPVPVLDPAHARFRVFDGVTSFLGAAARHQPLLLVLDDLHWADRPSLLLLEFLARALHDTPILVLGTYRDIEVRPTHPLLPVLAELVREPVCERITLGGLSAADVARFIELHTGRQHAATLADSVYEKSEGNPFFITELVRLLVDDADQPATDQALRPVTIPHGVQAVIARRLNRLSEECNRILTLAAAFGREFALAPLIHVSGTTAEGTLDALAEAARAGIVAEAPGSLDRYLFSHALVRDSLYAELGAIRRVRLHRRIAEVLADLYAADPAPRYDELTHHFFQAALGGEGVDEAVAYAVRAADYALTRFAYEQAAEHYEHALRALALTAPDEPRRFRVLLALGDAYSRASNLEHAKSVYLEAAAIARQRDDADGFTAAALGYGGIVVGVGTVNQTLVGLLEESLDRLREDDSQLRAMVMARLAIELYFAPEPTRRTALSEAAVDMARRLGDRTALIAALEAHHFCIWGTREAAALCALADEIVRLAEDLRDRERLLIGHQLRITDLLEMGDVVAVDAAIADYERLATALRQPAYTWRLKVFRAMRALMSGRFDEAEALMTAALSLGQRVQLQTANNFFGVQMYSLRREQGRLAELEDSVRVFTDSYAAVPSWRCALAGLYIELGRHAEARAQFEQLAANEFVLPQDNSRLMGLTLLAEVCAALEDRPRAATLYALLLPHAARNVVAGTAAACNGSVARPLALLAATLGRWDDAAAHFEAALQAHRRMGARPFVARTQLEYAALLCARARLVPALAAQAVSRARTLLASAAQTAAALGMVSVQARAAQLRAAIADGSMPAEAEASGGSRGGRAPDAANLFRRDGEMWTLGFAGEVCRIKDLRGLRYLAALLRQPHHELHVLDLMQRRERPRAAHGPSAARPPSPGTGPALDATSRRAYRQRLAQLRRDLEHIDATREAERAATLQRELNFLRRELGRGIGRGGRARPIAADHERARVGVTRAIKLALAAIQTRHPALAGHLSSAVRTGAYCRYSPPAGQHCEWRVEGDEPIS